MYKQNEGVGVLFTTRFLLRQVRFASGDVCLSILDLSVQSVGKTGMPENTSSGFQLFLKTDVSSKKCVECSFHPLICRRERRNTWWQVTERLPFGRRVAAWREVAWVTRVRNEWMSYESSVMSFKSWAHGSVVNGTPFSLHRRFKTWKDSGDGNNLLRSC